MTLSLTQERMSPPTQERGSRRSEHRWEDTQVRNHRLSLIIRLRECVDVTETVVHGEPQQALSQLLQALPRAKVRPCDS